MARRTQLRTGAIDHTSVFVGGTLNPTGQIVISPPGTTWELDILTNISENGNNAGGASVVTLNSNSGSGTYETILQLSGTPSSDATGDKRLFVFINGIELTASALENVVDQDSQIKIILDYLLDDTSDTIKVWYSV